MSHWFICVLAPAMLLGLGSLTNVETACFAGRSGPSIVDVGGSHELVLPKGVDSAIQTVVPGFRPWTIGDYADASVQHYEFSGTQCMFAVVGCFNDDPILDIAVDGHDAIFGYIVAAVSIDSIYQGEVLAKWHLPDSRERRDSFLELAPSGTVLHDADGDTILTLRREGIADVYEGRGWTLYYWDDEAFSSIAQGD